MLTAISPVQVLLSKLWWGPFRRPFEAVARRTIGRSQHILVGPLRGCYFPGGLSKIMGIYEPHIQQALLASLSQGVVFYDIGAHEGYFSLMASRIVGQSGCVYSFEPFPRNADEIQNVIVRNSVQNIRVQRVAVSDKDGLSNLSVGVDSFKPSLLERTRETMEVVTISLDEFIKTQPPPSLIKLDVEGAEVLVLVGATQLLAHCSAPTWIIETHDTEKEIEVVRLLTDNGYQVSPLSHPRERRSHYPAHLIASKKPEPI